MKKIYLDWAATGIPEEESIQNRTNNYANPSSIHTMGVESRRLLERARDRFAKLLGVSSRSVVFTSGGTEANNITIFSPLNTINIKNISRRIPKIITSSIEHASVYEPIKFLTHFGFEIKYIDPEPNGIIEPEKLYKALDGNVVLISVMTVNNETGAIQPIEEIGKIVKEYSQNTGKRIIFHTDAVQALGKIPFDIRKLAIDAASFSAHKLGAPKGVGSLYIGESTNISSLYRGGGQEFNRRPGTENLEGILSFTNILEKRIAELETNYTKTLSLSNTLIEKLTKIKEANIVPKDRLKEPEKYSPYILEVSFPPIPSEVLVRALAERGLMTSAGSACSSHRREKRGRVLIAMGLPTDVINSTVRFSLGYNTTKDEIEEAAVIVKETVARLIEYA